MFINIVILGATGDLASKKILPSCGEFISKRDDLHISIIPWSRKEITNFDQLNSYISMEKDIIQEGIVGDYGDPSIIDAFLQANSDKLNIFYLAIPPQGNYSFIEALSKTSMRNYEVILEKPYSQSKSDFFRLDELIYKNKLERKINFLDHYLFKDSYQFNPTVKKFLSTSINKPIKTISVKVLESIDVGNRLSFYNSTGAINDMFFHLFNIYYNFASVLDGIEEIQLVNLIKGQYESYITQLGEKSNTDTAFQAIYKSANQLITFDSAKKLGEKLTQLEAQFSDGSILTWCIYPLSRIEYYSKNTFLNLSLKQVDSDHYNIFNSLIENDKSKFVKLPTIRLAWMYLESLQNVDTEINIY
jgi:glucose-6-phosphate 1-dehydrogenase